MTDEEKKLLKLGVETLERIRAQMADLQVRVDMIFHMTEKYQNEMIRLA